MVIIMSKIVELPLITPMYSTYHHHGPATATVINNSSIRNWYLSNAMILTCNRKFLSGFTTPEINVLNTTFKDSGCFYHICYPMKFLKGYINPLIRNLIDAGYYVCFGSLDDYYIKGKSWYKQRHFYHNGMICGYNQKEKTYCIYAYDSNWIYQKFWTPQESFNKGRTAAQKKGIYDDIYAIKPKMSKIYFSPKDAYHKLKEYLDSNIEKYPFEDTGNVFGIIVHQYIAEYVMKLYDGSIPYERMDRRVFRLIWEHKNVMLERILAIEEILGFDKKFSEQYKPLVNQANKLRMLYASHHMKRRDSVLPIIKNNLLDLMVKERKILTSLVDEMGKVFENEALEIS